MWELMFTLVITCASAGPCDQLLKITDLTQEQCLALQLGYNNARNTKATCVPQAAAATSRR